MPPQPSGRAHAWRWKELRSLAERAGDLVPIHRGGDRRALALVNPHLNGRPYATPTLWGAIQYLGPGELAPPHRHSPAALRFVLEGTGVWTLVEGDSVAMAPGDLVLTPSWTWHEHHNPGDTPMIWFDGLDLPVVESLDSVFYEAGGSEARRDNPSRSLSEVRYGAGPGLLPLGPRPSAGHSPLYAYRWRDTDAALAALCSATPGEPVALRFADPSTGGDVMPTMRCEMHRLAGGTSTRSARQVGSAIWIVFSGSCTFDLGDQSFHLERGDAISVPCFSPLRLEAEEGADVFTVSDAPVVEKLGLAAPMQG